MMDFSLLMADLVSVSRYTSLNVVSRTVSSGIWLGIPSIALSDWVWNIFSFCQWVGAIVM